MKAEKKDSENYSVVSVKKPKPKQERKLARKCQRPKRRYILLQFGSGVCSNSDQAFNLVMGNFSLDNRKRFGTWFIGFDAVKSQAILRCKLEFLNEVKKGFEGFSKAKVLKVSGTLKALKSGKRAK